MQNQTITTKYLAETPAIIRIGRYSNHRTALQIISPDGELLLTATVNLPTMSLPPNHVLIKDYAENEGVLAALQAANVLIPTSFSVMSGFVELPVCELRPLADWQLPYQLMNNKGE
jgi:hypothetical protein